MAKSHGGPRKGAGRKPVDDKKVTLTIYPTQSEIDSVGGIEAAKALALNAIQAKKNILKKS
jgi:hypothetical protein